MISWAKIISWATDWQSAMLSYSILGFHVVANYQLIYYIELPTK